MLICTGWGLGILADMSVTLASGWAYRLSYTVIDQEVSG